MAAHAGEQAWKTGTFKCQSCNAEVRVPKGRKIPKCPNGHSTFDGKARRAPSGKTVAGPSQEKKFERAEEGFRAGAQYSVQQFATEAEFAHQFTKQKLASQ